MGVCQLVLAYLAAVVDLDDALRCPMPLVQDFAVSFQQLPLTLRLPQLLLS